MKILNVVVVLCLLLTSFSLYPEYSSAHEKTPVDEIVREVEIPPESDYWIKIKADNLEVIEKPLPKPKFTPKVRRAIAKVPSWIRPELFKRFEELNESYADLILSMEKKYVDEIAFSIVHSPSGEVPSVEVLKRNVLSLYENDKLLDFVDIVDMNMDSDSYRSTIRYRVLDNGEERNITCPSDIYYWYVVHPRIGFEEPELVYGYFWREYLMNHNDIGYPLLKEKLSGIKYLWDRESYIQPKKRTWNWSISNHPTAVEAVSYWVGKTVPVQAYGDRPLQPNTIAHEHNGWCGELFKVAVSAMRTALIPATGVNMKGEDHVWQQFYDEGWHQSDNWWEDGGGAINRSDVYAYVWKRNISSVYSWRGDGIIFDVTRRYLRENDYRTVAFAVRDRNGEPLDGIRVFVFVEGPLDWSGIKHTLWNLLVQNIWNRLPEGIKDRPIPSKVYTKLCELYERIPDVVRFAKTTVWNYTDLRGECRFALGVNRSYMFLVVGSKDVPIMPRLFFLEKGRDDKVFSVKTFFSKKPCRWKLSQHTSSSEGCADVSFSTKFYQLQPGIAGSRNPGKRWMNGSVDCFVMDKKNFVRYLMGKRFFCIAHSTDGDLSFGLDRYVFVVFRNPAVKSHAVVNFSLRIFSSRVIDRVRIITPSRELFDKPVFNVGGSINISGISTGDVALLIDGKTVNASQNGFRWWYAWNTENASCGEYLIEASCGEEKDELNILLCDNSPPTLHINSFSKVLNKDVISEMEIDGYCHDNVGIKEVVGTIDGEPVETTLNETTWSLCVNVSGLDVGEHVLKVSAIDESELTCFRELRFSVINDSYEERPSIIEVYHVPSQPERNESITIYANISTLRFSIDRVILHVESNTTNFTREMFLYGAFPVQKRHSEDPLANVSNAPLYGVELGEFSPNTTLTYWIEATNSANLSAISEKRTIY